MFCRCLDNTELGVRKAYIQCTHLTRILPDHCAFDPFRSDLCLDLFLLDALSWHAGYACFTGHSRMVGYGL